jgi:hypothetical protein
LPTGIAKQSSNTTIPVSTILPGQFDHIFDETFFVFIALWKMTLRGAILTKYTTGSAFRDTKPVTHLINAFAPT